MTTLQKNLFLSAMWLLCVVCTVGIWYAVLSYTPSSDVESYPGATLMIVFVATVATLGFAVVMAAATVIIRSENK